MPQLIVQHISAEIVAVGIELVVDIHPCREALAGTPRRAAHRVVARRLLAQVAPVVDAVLRAPVCGIEMPTRRDAIQQVVGIARAAPAIHVVGDLDEQAVVRGRSARALIEVEGQRHHIVRTCAQRGREKRLRLETVVPKGKHCTRLLVLFVNIVTSRPLHKRKGRGTRCFSMGR